MKPASFPWALTYCRIAFAPLLATAGVTVASPGSNHWSFLPVTRPPLPRVDAATPVNPIDCLVFEELRRRGLKPRPASDRRALMRRVHFDLLGLPPAPEEVEAFVQDPDPDAYCRLVERLLESPHYGERWGRHWLDVAGYAESSMFIGDVPRQGFWRYRDYVIRAFNSDKPYDQFILEQLAGDELFNWREADAFTPEQTELLAATGFLRCTPDATDNQPITQMDKRHAAQQSAVEVSMKAVMGLTINCVRCHDHKFDPITQEEYYGLVAVFQPAFDPGQWLPGIYTKDRPGPLRGIPLLPGAERRRLMDESEGWFEERLALGAAIGGRLERDFRDRWLRDQLGTVEDPDMRERLRQALETAPDDRPEPDEQLCAKSAKEMGLSADRLKELFPEFDTQLAAAKSRVEELKSNNAAFEEVLWCAFDTSVSPTPARFLTRGNYEQPAHTVGPGVIQVLNRGRPAVDFNQPPGPWTTGRRLALARWLADASHPLTARVLVNRVWQYHFGAGLVATPDDFGARGARPVSQDLLDWLAAEFMEHGWSVKHLHRLILQSATYGQASAGGFSPMPALLPQPRRLEAESFRDALLETAGLLDKRLFGRSVPTERRADGSFGIKAGHEDRWRRSIYISTRRTYVPTFLALFDQPIMDTNWPKRSASAIAQQALAMMNDAFAVDCAQAFANRVIAEGGGTFLGRLHRAYALAYQRAPAEEEIALFESDAPASEADWRVLCQALLGSNEFLYID